MVMHLRVASESQNYFFTHQQKPKLESNSESAPSRRGRRPRNKETEAAQKKKKPEDVRSECTLCKQTGTNANLVRYKPCECSLCKQTGTNANLVRYKPSDVILKMAVFCDAQNYHQIEDVITNQ